MPDLFFSNQITFFFVKFFVEFKRGGKKLSSLLFLWNKFIIRADSVYSALINEKDSK